MDKTLKFRFETDRMLVDEWRSFDASECNELNLVNIVVQILTPNVTSSLPPSWQGKYTPARAEAWIEERLNEGVTTLVVDKASKDPIGLMILFSGDNAEVHLGYLLSESSWGRGLASELVHGFTLWCQGNDIKSVVGGVAKENIASRRVLEKNGFQLVPETAGADEQMFRLKI